MPLRHKKLRIGMNVLFAHPLTVRNTTSWLDRAGRERHGEGSHRTRTRAAVPPGRTRSGRSRIVHGSELRHRDCYLFTGCPGTGHRGGPPDATGLRPLGTGLDITGLSRRFTSGRNTVTALDSVDLRTSEGQFLSVLGPSGCGKSTVLRILAGSITRMPARYS